MTKQELSNCIDSLKAERDSMPAKYHKDYNDCLVKLCDVYGDMVAHEAEGEKLASKAAQVWQSCKL